MALVAMGFEINANSYKNDFVDVNVTDWYYPYIATGYSKNLLKGIGENTFGIGESITRQDICVMLYRIMQSEQTASIENVFSDNDEISDYAVQAVYSMKEKGVIQGKGNNRFDPHGIATRAEAAQIIYNFLTKK